jgi:hypothetical protein
MKYLKPLLIAGSMAGIAAACGLAAYFMQDKENPSEPLPLRLRLRKKRSVIHHA